MHYGLCLARLLLVMVFLITSLKIALRYGLTFLLKCTHIMRNALRKRASEPFNLLNLCIDSFCSEENLRIGSFLAVFMGIWKGLTKASVVYNIGQQPKPNRSSTVTLPRKRLGFLIGFLSGASILTLHHTNHLTLSQQFFARGLQAAYTYYTLKPEQRKNQDENAWSKWSNWSNWRIEHGASLLFMIACGHCM